MGNRHRPCDPRPNITWTRTCCAASVAIVAATAGAVVLSTFSGQFEGHLHLFRGQNKHLLMASILIDDSAGDLGAVNADGDLSGASRALPGMRGLELDLEMAQSSGDDTLVRDTTALLEERLKYRTTKYKYVHYTRVVHTLCISKCIHRCDTAAAAAVVCRTRYI